VQWFNVHDVPGLIYDHNQILDFGFKHLKHKVRHEPIGFNLLPEKFTLLQLQEMYEAILEIKLDKSNFRRKLAKMKLLINCKEKQKDVINCKEKQKDVSHRAAGLYKFDKRIYVTLRKSGMVFEL